MSRGIPFLIGAEPTVDSRRQSQSRAYFRQSRHLFALQGIPVEFCMLEGKTVPTILARGAFRRESGDLGTGLLLSRSPAVASHHGTVKLSQQITASSRSAHVSLSQLLICVNLPLVGRFDTFPASSSPQHVTAPLVVSPQTCFAALLISVYSTSGPGSGIGGRGCDAYRSISTTSCEVAALLGFVCRSLDGVYTCFHVFRFYTGVSCLSSC